MVITPAVLKQMKKLFIQLSIVLTLFNFVSCKQWEVPTHLLGNWQSKQAFTVRTKTDGNFVFVQAPDSVLLSFTIDNTGKLTGKIGNADLVNCKVEKNRGELGRKLNLATDYVVKGELNGSIFQNDPNPNKKISAPFNVINNKMEGSLFQLFGMDLYPMSSFNATKQP